MRNVHSAHIDIPLVDYEEISFDEEITRIIEDQTVLESRTVYFSAGSARIKEVLIKRDPSVSV
ncbi:MAG: hypothetical protein ACOCWH_04205 [Spirochaetota bacterium]